MVQLMRSANIRPEPETTSSSSSSSCRDKRPVKLEIEDSLEEEHGPLNKRSKPSQAFQEVRNRFWFVWFSIKCGKG
jgi:hypothetical protein